MHSTPDHSLLYHHDYQPSAKLPVDVAIKSDVVTAAHHSNAEEAPLTPHKVCCAYYCRTLRHLF